MKYQCVRCGFNGYVRIFYTCKAPFCEVRGYVLCSNCEGELRKLHGNSYRKCHHCKVGEMENLGSN